MIKPDRNELKRIAQQLNGTEQDLLSLLNEADRTPDGPALDTLCEKVEATLIVFSQLLFEANEQKLGLSREMPVWGDLHYYRHKPTGVYCKLSTLLNRPEQDGPLYLYEAVSTEGEGALTILDAFVATPEVWEPITPGQYQAVLDAQLDTGIQWHTEFTISDPSL